MKIYIDVGHGKVGEDSGASGVLSTGVKVYESTYVLDIAKTIRVNLQNKGHEVTLSREADENKGPLVGKYGRVDSNIINSASHCKTGDFDLMISLHCNSATNKKATGYVLYWKTGNDRAVQSEDLARTLATPMQMVGLVQNDLRACPYGADVKGDNYGILRLHDKIGVLVECAFMSNANDLARLSKASFRATLGQAIAYGIDQYCRDHTVEINTEKIEKLEQQIEKEAETPAIDYMALYNDLLPKYNDLVKQFNELSDNYQMVNKHFSEAMVQLNKAGTERDEARNKLNQIKSIVG